MYDVEQQCVALSARTSRGYTGTQEGACTPASEHGSGACVA